MSATAILPVELAAEFDTHIRAHGESEYPNECCGILYGTDRDGVRTIVEIEPVANAFESGEQFHRFSITSEVLLKAERTAAGKALLVIGFYHSHPDHPARPSEFDRVHAWPFYSYLIVAIAGGKSTDLTSWILDDSTEQFTAQQIRVKP